MFSAIFACRLKQRLYFCVVKHKMNRITLIFKEDNKMKMLKSIWKRFGEADKHVWGYSTMY